jgi:hypothetical protein
MLNKLKYIFGGNSTPDWGYPSPLLVIQYGVMTELKTISYYWFGIVSSVITT